MTTLQQRTKAWHSARAGKLTASNLASVLGLSQFCSRSESYDRLMGRVKFEGNDATHWGASNEQNGINAYLSLLRAVAFLLTRLDQSGLNRLHRPPVLE